MICLKCPDFEKRMEHLNSFITFQSLRAGKSLYKNPPFIHCPWCGETLMPPKKKER